MKPLLQMIAFALALAVACISAVLLTIQPNSDPFAKTAQSSATELQEIDKHWIHFANEEPRLAGNMERAKRAPEDGVVVVGGALDVPEVTSSAYFHALDPANRMASLDDSWIPTESAWREHVAPLVELAGRITIAEARAVFGEDETDEIALLSGEGTWAERFGVPTDDDIGELWRAPGTLELFATALQKWGHASALQTSEQFRGERDLVAAIDRSGVSAWRRAFERPSGYRWWPLLAEIGLRLEYGGRP